MTRKRRIPEVADSILPSTGPLPPLSPYQRCRCGVCRTCLDNEKWDRIFAKFEVSSDEWETKGFFQSTLRGY